MRPIGEGAGVFAAEMADFLERGSFTSYVSCRYEASLFISLRRRCCRATVTSSSSFVVVSEMMVSLLSLYEENGVTDALVFNESLSPDDDLSGEE